MVSLPKTQKALVQEQYGKPLAAKTVPVPEPTSGAVVVKVIYAPIISYMKKVYNGERKYRYVNPLVPGTSAFGKVVAIGPDALLLKEGDLVYVDCYIRGRDDHDAGFLLGLSEGGGQASRRLMQHWINGTFAEYVKAPLENVFKVDEQRLCGSPSQGGLGFKMEQLSWWMAALVPYGGLRSIDLQAGETVIVTPATGNFGSAAVLVALAMGAGKVIAVGRNAEALSKLKARDKRIETVQTTGDLKTEMEAIQAFGKADVHFDISPAVSEGSTYLRAAIQSLRHSGRVSLMGGFADSDNIAFMKLLSSGALNIKDIVNVHGVFGLEDWEKGFDLAWDNGRLGDLVLFAPSGDREV
ncbi:hypothetical protein M409DRAFT_67682 [Zasmidium cellare ATCC 36951]|uniref:Alcohol dehydrogenase-like C-terminal domain-containing protein n=1 Tax=Zasmidium cellare ATCC 36951 TaxID=1080233 RepID=A0A6A6CCU3_ZASCE|nr:uncharacterized protein M409DRAFT_67682 [Zasmidium cellare ATCC 36951]KAF2165017.1 hypothetical protein M409DRAFT_67682 [Zasmidium cellare ATCC 36951]